MRTPRSPTNGADASTAVKQNSVTANPLHRHGRERSTDLQCASVNPSAEPDQFAATSDGTTSPPLSTTMARRTSSPFANNPLSGPPPSPTQPLTINLDRSCNPQLLPQPASNGIPKSEPLPDNSATPEVTFNLIRAVPASSSVLNLMATHGEDGVFDNDVARVTDDGEAERVVCRTDACDAG